MRFLTILISLIVGIALGIVFLNNAHGVVLNLDPFLKTPQPPHTPYRVFPLWIIMAVCAGIGVFLGWLLGMTSAYNAAPAKPAAPPVQKKPEHDYLVIDAAPAKRHGP